jgi:hypothetical protein
MKLYKRVGISLVAFCLMTGIRQGFPGPVSAAPAPSKTTFSAQRTSENYSLHVTGARWVRQRELQPGWPVTTFQDRAKRVLFVAGSVISHAPVPDSPATSLSLGEATEVVAIGPQGQRLVGYHTRMDVSEQGWIFDNPDTHWDQLRLEFVLKEPSAPIGADGTIGERADLSDVPVFFDINIPHSIDKTLTTKLGTKLIFSSLHYDKLPPSLGDLRNLFLDFTVVPPASAPDLRLEVEPQVITPAIVDDLGNNLSDNNWLCRPNYQPPQYQLRLTIKTPPSTAKMLNLHLYVFQKVPNLRKAALFHPFAPILLPRAAIGLAPTEVAPPPIFSVRSSGLRVTVESLTAGHSGNDYARIWVRDETQPQEVRAQAWSKFWRIGKAVLRGASGVESDGLVVDPLYWKLNGTPALGNETGYDLDFQAGIFQPPPPKLTLLLQMEQAARVYHALDFIDLPIPLPGQVLDVNVASAYGTEGKYVATKIGNFDAGHALSAYNGALNQEGQEMNPALYAVLTFVPTVPGGTVPPATFGNDADELSVIDDQGGHLTREDASPIFGYGELLDKPFLGWQTLPSMAGPHPLLLIMTPPSPGAKMFSIHRRITIISRTGKTVNFVVPDLHLPMPRTEP